MASKTMAHSPPDTYFALVKAFPLIHIQDATHLKHALQTIDALLQKELDQGQEAYLDVLTDLVETYEQKRVLIPDASEADVLRELMASNTLNQHALSRLVGISQSTISSVLNGTRSLTKSQVETLARHFHISPSVFFTV